MKEMLKSKYLIMFILFMMGVTYFNSLGVEKLNSNRINQNEVSLNR